MVKRSLLLLSFLVAVGVSFSRQACSAQLPTVEETRGILYICSQGYSKTTGIKGSLEADAAAIRLLRGLEAGLEGHGSINEQEVGAIIERTMTEEGAIKIHEMYQECLNRHLTSFMSSGNDLEGPGIQKTRMFTLIAQDAHISSNTAIVVISAKFHRSRVGSLKLEPSTFKAISSGGSVFRLVDDGGLSRGFTVDSGDQLSMTLVFERASGSATMAEDRINVSGSIDRYSNGSKRETNAVGLRDIPVRAP